MPSPAVKIVSRYQYDAYSRPGVKFDAKDADSRSVTNQSDKDGADINKIMARYEKTGTIVVNGENRRPMYGDFTAVPDFRTAQNRIAGVRAAFEALPASTRNRFDNDPQKLIDFLGKPENNDEAVKLGLRPKPAKKDPDPADKGVSPGVPAAAPVAPPTQ